MVVSTAVATNIRDSALLTSHHAKATASKVNRASHGPRVLAKARANKVREMDNPNENPKVPRVPKVRRKARVRRLVCRILKPRFETHRETQETAQTCPTDHSYIDKPGWLVSAPKRKKKSKEEGDRLPMQSPFSNVRGRSRGGAEGGAAQ